MDDKLLELAETLSNRTTLDDIWSAVCDGLAAMGLPEVSWGHVDPKEDPPSGRAIRSTVPIGFWEEYLAAGHYVHDPVVLHFLQTDDPFVDHYGWHDPNRIPVELRDLAFARFAVAERSLGRSKIGILSMGSDFDAEGWREHVDRNMTQLTLAARMCAAYLATVEPPTEAPRLSPREAECLTLLAQGHRNDRIAERLGLHRATVEMHIVRARRKLGGKTREQAVAQAVLTGAIRP